MNIQWPADNWKNLTPRRWQVDALKVLMQHYSVEKPTNAIVRAITGAGKSKAMAQFLACCQLKSNETIVVSTPSIYLVEQLEETFRDRLESKGGFMEPRRVGTFYTHGKDIMEPIILACSDSIPELARRLQNIGKRCALWMADECCAQGTLIDTPNGRVSIETIRAGDTVLGFDHVANKAIWTKVKHVFINPFYGHFVSVGEALKVTPNHPIFSDSENYIEAGLVGNVCSVSTIQPTRIQNGDMRVVQKRVRCTHYQDWKAAEILCACVPSKVCQFDFVDSRAKGSECCEIARNQKKTRCPEETIRAPSFGKQPSQKSRCYSQSANCVAGVWLQNANWRQRHWSYGTAEVARGAIGVGNRSGCTHGYEERLWLSTGLQNRHCRHYAYDRRRSRWRESSVANSLSEGCQKDTLSELAGLDHLEILESRHSTKFGHCDEAHHGACVYNIETETGNYFAEGILVHNCHKTEVKTLKDAYATLLPNTVLGFTGTPWRANEKESLSLFEKMIVDYGPAKAIADKNVVVPWRIIRWEDKRELCLDETCYEMTKNAVGPGMFNALTIADAVKFAGYLKLKGFPAEAVHSKMPKEDVKKILSNLQRGILRAVVHVNKLAEGADFPWLCWLCMRRPVTSRVRFPQEIGRVLRFDDGIASGTGRVKTEAILYDPHGLFDVMKLTYEEVLGGDFIIDEPDVEEDEGRRLNRQLEGRGFDLMRHLTEVKAGKQPLQTEPLAAYLTELVNAFDLCGLIDRKIASRSWRNEAVTGQQEKTVVNMRWVPNARKCVPSIHKTALQILTGANETVDGERKKFAAKMNRGVASDLLSVLMSLADKKKWPNFSQLDKSASEQLEKHKVLK